MHGIGDITALVDYWPNLREVVLILAGHMFRHHSAEACNAYTALVDATDVLVTVCVRVIGGAS